MSITTSNEIIALSVFLLTAWLGTFLYFGKIMRRKSLEDKFYKDDLGKGNSTIEKIKKAEQEMNFLEKLQRELDRARIKMTANAFIVFSIIFALVLGTVGFIVLKTIFFSIVLFAVGLVIPYFYVKSKRSKFEEKFDEEMVKALRRMGAILRVGGSLDQALNDVITSNTVPDIVRYEFGNVYAAYKAGFKINDAFYELYKSVGTKDVLFLCTAIDIQMKTGGDKADVMDSIAAQITNKNLKQRGIKAKLAEVDMSVKTMAVMPFVFIAIIGTMNPGHFDFFTSSFTGELIAFALVSFMIGGYFVIKKMSKIEM